MRRGRTQKRAKKRDEIGCQVWHSWFNRFRKLLVRYAKLERSYIFPNQLTAAIITFMKIKTTINVVTDIFLLHHRRTPC